MHIQFSVHQQHVIPFRFRALNIGVVCIRIIGIKEHHVTVFVHLVLTHLVFVFVQRCVLTVEVLVEREARRFLVELLIRQHSELDEHLDVVPFLGELVLVGFVEFRQFVGYFLGDVSADFLDVVIGLQITTADV